MKVRLALVLVLLCAVAAQAQKHELSISGGGLFPSRNNVSLDKTFGFQVGYAGRLFHAPAASLFVELPLAIGMNNGFTTTIGATTIQDNYNSLFFTPALKVKLAPEFPMSPWVSAGYGVAYYKRDSGATNNTNVFSFGGGLDIKVAPYVSIRGEVRDFYTGEANIFQQTTTVRQHNVFAGAGLVFRF